jgi:hypothetical protein
MPLLFWQGREVEGDKTRVVPVSIHNHIALEIELRLVR